MRLRRTFVGVEAFAGVKAFVGVLAEQAETMALDIDGLYANWFIETCQDWVVPYIGDLLRVPESVLEDNFGAWGSSLAGKARGEDAGAWFEGEIGESHGPKSISHEHTYDRDTANVARCASGIAAAALTTRPGNANVTRKMPAAPEAMSPCRRN